METRSRTDSRDAEVPPGAEHSSDAELRRYLSDYYGKQVSRTEDLERNACCADDTRQRYREIVASLPDDVVRRNYGCGSSFPEDDLSGLDVLDLGSGAGLDAFIVARLVGPEGSVQGIDMTAEQLDVARRSVAPVMQAYGYGSPNVTFHQGYIETAEAIADESIDLVISDCTINLSPRKDLVFETIRRVLRPGGELYISDIVADRRVPERLTRDRLLVAECLGGALYENDLFDTMEAAGFRDARVVARRVTDEDVAGCAIRFDSVTLRAFKLSPALDRRCEDYGQVAFYRGACAAQPARFVFDDHHLFEAHRPVPVCRNTARMLSETRLARYFEVTPPRQHLGLFDTRAAAQDPPGSPRCC